MSKLTFHFSALLHLLLGYSTALLVLYAVFQKDNLTSKHKCKLWEG